MDHRNIPPLINFVIVLLHAVYQDFYSNSFDTTKRTK